MNAKSILLSTIFAIFTLSTFAQLKVDRYGRIGMGTNWPNPGYKCHIKGNLLLTTYPASPFVEFQFKVQPGWAILGTNVDHIAAWSPWVNFNKLYAEQYYRLSDASFKLNKAAIDSPMRKLSELKPYKYDMIDRYITESGDSLQRTLPQYGFISQEVEQSLPEIKITDDAQEGKLMDYDQIIPLLVAGIQEQQKSVRALEAQIAKLMATNQSSSSNSSLNGSGINNGSESNNSMDLCKLFSCSPNPFSTTTQISYYLNSTVIHAELRVYDMQGIERTVINLDTNQGNSYVNLQAQDLPVNGTYIYALFVDSQIVDAKTVIKQ
ncbi:T9SS type A sorting domain-containing protein [Cryomorpha ignava]|uniref:T9SS type A sorting domain-containing protein n=1 Tax=Cryomorpha ignava TaxID=101383 RepID=A0A7K3WW10_9FLAO|nr:tail fiber domain-containing protein [Cryomorpha ignava]NEN25704.1 T9SS type A sorting domain-containing protein [Cryomorpha ignava]